MTRKYHLCGWPIDSVTHFRVCVPRKQWPAWMRQQKLTVIVPEGAFVCDCGYEASGATALRMHRYKSKLHREPVHA